MFHVEHNIDFISNCGLYIHVPFCKSKCAYCDFYRIIDLGLLDKYVESLIGELGSYKDKICKIDTIYFGGGTPSILGYKRLDMILKYIIQNYDLSELRELTVECNPENVDDEYPPTFIWATECDECVPIKHSYLLIDALKAHNIKYEFNLFKNGIHGGSLCNHGVYNADFDFAFNCLASSLLVNLEILYSATGIFFSRGKSKTIQIIMKKSRAKG